MIRFQLGKQAGMRMEVVFYRTDSGGEPVRDWLRDLVKSDKRVIGGDIKTVQYGWSLGMPVVRKLEQGLWEFRSRLDKRIARILFTVRGRHNDSAARIYQAISEDGESGP